MKKTILLISTLTFSMFVVKAQNANLTNNLLDLGYGISGREGRAGKIGYQTWTSDALDITGAGTTDGNRKIKFWNEGGASFVGTVSIGDVTNLGPYSLGVGGKIAARSATLTNLEVGGSSPTGSNPHATIYFHHHGLIANQLRYNGGHFYFEKCTNGWGSHDPTVSIGNVANLGSYSLGVGGKISAIGARFMENIEVVGSSPTGSNPHATIYFHHLGVSANQLRYNGGHFYFEKCTNGWESHDPKVIIGDVTNPGSFSLAVGGKIAANGEVRVFTTNTSSFPDYVFDTSYQLPTLEDTEKYIQQNKHLPEVPTASEIEKEGMSLNGMNEILLKKVEELTLHIIRLSKENEALKKRMEQIEKK